MPKAARPCQSRCRTEGPPDAFAADPDRLARFEREAQLLATLNHPHIATRFEERNGIVSPDGRRFLMIKQAESGDEPTALP